MAAIQIDQVKKRFGTLQALGGASACLSIEAALGLDAQARERAGARVLAHAA
jgi:hypothetical protein